MNRKKQSSASNSSSNSGSSQGASKSESSQERRRRKWRDYIPEQGKCDPKVPYIIRPRCTVLLDPKPVLQWNEVAQVNRYTVSLSSTGQRLWEIETEATQIDYPGDLQLVPETDYTLLVQTNTGIASSKDESPEAIQFSILSEPERQQVEAEVQQVQAAQTEEAQTLAVAEIYHKYGLRAEAIDLLKTAEQNRSELPALYQLLGDLYSEVGLLPKAEVSYLKTVEFAKNAKELEIQALISARLCTIYKLLDNSEEMNFWLLEAKALYAELGNPEAIEELEEQLATLKP